MYLGRSRDGVLAETLLRDPSQEKVMWSDVEARREAILRTIEPLQLAMAHGSGLSYLGVQQADVVSNSYAVPQSISARIYNETKLDGIQYRSRFDSDELCIALFERSSHKVQLLVRDLPIAETIIGEFLRARGKRLARR